MQRGSACTGVAGMVDEAMRGIQTRCRMKLLSCMRTVCWSLLGVLWCAVASANPHYELYCASCHGTQTDNGFAPRLFGTTLDTAAFRRVVREGREPMPAFLTADLSDAEVAAIHTWLQTAGNAQPARTQGSSRTTPTLATGPRLPTGVNVEALRKPSPGSVYRLQCAGCHGAVDAPLNPPGLQRDISGALPLSIPDLRFMTMTFEDFSRLTYFGHGRMPAFPRLRYEQLDLPLYEYLRGLRPAQPKQVCRDEARQTTHRHWGAELYTSQCARCHGGEFQGSPASDGRAAVPALNRAVPVGRIREFIRNGHANRLASPLPHLTDSDVFQLAAYVAVTRGWDTAPPENTPAAFTWWNGGQCRKEVCTTLAHAADERIAARPSDWRRPNAGTEECAAFERKPKGVASPDNQCWAKDEVDRFESLCDDFQPGISARYPRAPEVQAVVTTQAVANTTLRSAWTRESAVLTCQFGPEVSPNLQSPHRANPSRANWQLRLYLPLLDRANPKAPTSGGGCWWAQPEQTLGQGNPRSGKITLYVRLPEGGAQPAEKWWPGGHDLQRHHGLENEREPLSSFSKTERPFYEAIQALRRTGQFSIRVHRNVIRDERRKNTALTSGNPVFSNVAWSADQTGDNL